MSEDYRTTLPSSDCDEGKAFKILASRIQGTETDLKDYVPKKLCLDSEFAPHYPAVSRLLTKHPEIRTAKIQGKIRVHYADWLRMIAAKRAEREKAIDENPKLIRSLLADSKTIEIDIAEQKKKLGEDRVNQAQALTRLLTPQKK